MRSRHQHRRGRWRHHRSQWSLPYLWHSILLLQQPIILPFYYLILLTSLTLPSLFPLGRPGLGAHSLCRYAVTSSSVILLAPLMDDLTGAAILLTAASKRLGRVIVWEVGYSSWYHWVRTFRRQRAGLELQASCAASKRSISRPLVGLAGTSCIGGGGTDILYQSRFPVYSSSSYQVFKISLIGALSTFPRIWRA